MYIEESIWPKFSAFMHFDRKISGKTKNVYSQKSVFKRLVQWFSTHEFTRENLIALLSSMQQKGYTASTMSKPIAMCKNLARFYKIDSFRDFTYFHETWHPQPILTPDEITLLINATPRYAKQENYLQQRYKTLLRLLAFTGCRISEALGLEWKDITDNSQVIFSETKNGETRLVPLDKETYTLLKKLPRKSKYIFPSYRGDNPLDYTSFRNDLKIRAGLVGIKKSFGAHAFRRSYVTIMLEQGIDSVDLCKLTGHKDPEVLLRYKLSSPNYYRSISLMHPLLRGQMTPEQITKQIRDFVDRTIDPKVYPYAYNINANQISINITFPTLQTQGAKLTPNN